MVTNQQLVLGEATLVEVNRGRSHEPAGSWHKQGPATGCKHPKSNRTKWLGTINSRFVFKVLANWLKYRQCQYLSIRL